VRTGPADTSSLASVAGADIVLVDARRDLIKARDMCRLLRRTGADVAVIAVMTEGSLAALTAEWGADDVILYTAGPAEVEARLRLAVGRRTDPGPASTDEIRSGDLSIDEATYVARLRNRVLDLTFKEFELLKFLAQHPGRVFTRAQLLQEVWGYDYFGGTRTVDVHVRRLRAKLGAEHEGLVGTVRNVGYRFVPLKNDDSRRGQHPGHPDNQPAKTPRHGRAGTPGGGSTLASGGAPESEDIPESEDVPESDGAPGNDGVRAGSQPPRRVQSGQSPSRAGRASPGRAPGGR
jgi:DNA-binding response OmpR family regulator